jgi:hypothetical protein
VTDDQLQPHVPAAAAGWYPDDTGRTRWWNGTAWAQYAPERVTNGPATASLVLGLVGVALAFTLVLAPFSVPLILAGFVLGIIGLRRSSRNGKVGGGKAVAGIIICGLPILLVVYVAVTGNTVG